MPERDLGPSATAALACSSRTEPSTYRWSLAGPWVMAALVALKLWLVAGQQRIALCHAVHDDALFPKLAGYLVRGEWLGPYDQFTLFKGPGYPLWVAGNFFLGLPLHISQHLLYASACALFVLALRPRLPSSLVRLGLFAVLLFQPMSFSTSTLRHTRDPFYATQVFIAVSCLLGQLVWLAAPLRVLVHWSLGLGGMAGWVWITREEGVWMLPVVGAAWALMAFHLWRARSPDWWRRALALALPLAVALVLVVAQINWRYYGIFTISDFNRGEFAAAVGALARVEPVQWRRWVIVPQEVRARIYPHSPAFRELQPMLEGAPGKLWATMGQEFIDFDQAAMQAEIKTGWFAIALRDAARLPGHYSSALAARRYYARLAAEVNAACAAGHLRCGPARSSLAPPWRSEYLGLTLRSLYRGAAYIITLTDSPMLPSVGTNAQIAVLQDLTNDRFAPVVGTVPPPSRRTALAPSERTALDQWKLTWLAAIHRLYAATLPPVGVLSMASFVLCLVLRCMHRPCRLLGPALVLLIAIGARLTLLAYVEATALPIAASNPLYVCPFYPLLLAFFLLALLDGLCLLGLVRWWRAPR